MSDQNPIPLAQALEGNVVHIHRRELAGVQGYEIVAAPASDATDDVRTTAGFVEARARALKAATAIAAGHAYESALVCGMLRQLADLLEHGADRATVVEVSRSARAVADLFVPEGSTATSIREPTLRRMLKVLDADERAGDAA